MPTQLCSQSNLPALHLAIARNEAAVCLSMIEAAQDLSELEQPDIHGRTPLRMACQQDHIDMWAVMRALVVAGCDLESRDKLGYTPQNACTNKELPLEKMDAWQTCVLEAISERQARILASQAAPAQSVKRRSTL